MSHFLFDVYKPYFAELYLNPNYRNFMSEQSVSKKSKKKKRKKGTFSFSISLLRKVYYRDGKNVFSIWVYFYAHGLR